MARNPARRTDLPACCPRSKSPIRPVCAYLALFRRRLLRRRLLRPLLLNLRHRNRLPLANLHERKASLLRRKRPRATSATRSTFPSSTSPSPSASPPSLLPAAPSSPHPTPSRTSLPTPPAPAGPPIRRLRRYCARLRTRSLKEASWRPPVPL